MQDKFVRLCLVYILSTTVEITFNKFFIDFLRQFWGNKLFKLQTFQTSALCEKLSNVSSLFFRYHSQKCFKKAFFRVIKVPYKSVLLSVITCRHLSDLLYPKVLYKSVLLSSKNVVLHKLTSLIIPKSVF